MDFLVGKLEELGLKKFITAHRHELCKTTINPQKMAASLGMDVDQIANIMDLSGPFAKCLKLYEYIQIMATPSRFLQALENTNNGKVIEFIELVLTGSSNYGQMQTSSSRPEIWFNIPEPIESFCGREDFLSQLHDKLQHQHTLSSAAATSGSTQPKSKSRTLVTVLSQIKIVSGLGGIGKTETATQYIMQHQSSYNNFIWINAESENSMRNSFLKLAHEIQIPVKNADGKPREIEEIVKEIYNKIFEGEKSNLIVFDNAEDYQSCKTFFPVSLRPDLKKLIVILATSRNQEWISPKGKEIPVLSLDVMTDYESLEFILKELEIEDSPEFREESKEFIDLIGGLPLALQQAVAFIRQEKELRELAGTAYKMSDYVQEFKSSMEKFLSFSPVPESVPDSPTVFVTWNVTFAKIEKLANGQEAVKILEILSFLYADKIPFSFLYDLVPETELRNFSLALKLLKKYSLIKMNVTNHCLSIHRQLQFVILQYLQKCNDVSNVVMNILDKCQVVLKNIKLPKSSDIILNVHQIVKTSFDLIPVTGEFLRFMNDFAGVLLEASRYSESLDLLNKAYRTCRVLCGENDKRAIALQNNMAYILVQLGRHDESLNLYKEILVQHEIHPDLGVDHPNTITVKHNMADVLLNQKKYQKSLELFEHVLQQKSKVHGENHPLTLNTQHHMAVIYGELGDLPKALTMHEYIEKKRTQIQGPAHKDVLHTKYTKATILYEMGKLKQASKIFNEGYETAKEILGECHVETTNFLDGIAIVLEHEGRFDEALIVYKKVYEARKMNLGENHPNTIKLKNHIANFESIMHAISHIYASL